MRHGLPRGRARGARPPLAQHPRRRDPAPRVFGVHRVCEVSIPCVRRCGCCSMRRTWRAAWTSTWTCARGSTATGAASPAPRSGPTVFGVQRVYEVSIPCVRRCGCCSTRRTWRAAWTSTWTCARGSTATGATFRPVHRVCEVFPPGAQVRLLQHEADLACGMDFHVDVREGLDRHWRNIPAAEIRPYGPHGPQLGVRDRAPHELAAARHGWPTRLTAPGRDGGRMPWQTVQGPRCVLCRVSSLRRQMPPHLDSHPGCTLRVAVAAPVPMSMQVQLQPAEHMEFAPSAPSVRAGSQCLFWRCAVQARAARPPDLLRQLGLARRGRPALRQLAPVRAAPVLAAAPARGAAPAGLLLLERPGRHRRRALPAGLPLQARAEGRIQENPKPWKPCCVT